MSEISSNHDLSKKAKRSRCKNYSELEKENLIVIANKYKAIIENKCTDAVWAAEKSKAWKEIAASYNPTSVTGIRTGPQLKLLFENLKKKAKKHKADDKVEVYKTGGGPPPVSQLTESDSKLIAMLGPQMESRRNVYDCNADFDMGNNSEDTIILEMDESMTNSAVELSAYEEDLAAVRIRNNPVNVDAFPNPPTVSMKSVDKISSEKHVVPKTKSWKSSFIQRVKGKQAAKKSSTKDNDHAHEIFLMKKIKHEQQMAILEIIKKRASRIGNQAT